MDLSKYRKVVITTKTPNGIPRVSTKILYEADLVIIYHEGEFIIYKDRYSDRNKEIDESLAAKFLLQEENTIFPKWEKRKKFKKELNEPMQS